MNRRLRPFGAAGHAQFHTGAVVRGVAMSGNFVRTASVISAFVVLRVTPPDNCGQMERAVSCCVLVGTVQVEGSPRTQDKSMPRA